MRLLCLAVLCVCALVYYLCACVWGLLRWCARSALYLLYVKVLSLGRETAVLSSLRVAKRPNHLCLAFQRVLPT